MVGNPNVIISMEEYLDFNILVDDAKALLECLSWSRHSPEITAAIGNVQSILFVLENR